MICPNCSSTEGHYSNIEDFNCANSCHPGSDPEWSYYECWTCYGCKSSFYSYEDVFEYGEDE